jgi:hypothetical protein
VPFYELLGGSRKIKKCPDTSTRRVSLDALFVGAVDAWRRGCGVEQRIIGPVVFPNTPGSINKSKGDHESEPRAQKKLCFGSMI